MEGSTSSTLSDNSSIQVPGLASRGRVVPDQEHISQGLAKLWRQVSIMAVALGGIIGALSAAITTLFLLKPNLAPSTVNSADITNVTIEPTVTLEQYFSDLPVRSELERLKATYPERTKILMNRDRPRLSVAGTVVDFGLQVRGLRGMPIAERWSLFDADSGKRLGESQDLDPLPLSFTIEEKDWDTGSWESWIDTSAFSNQHFFVRLELFDTRYENRIVFKDTSIFTAPVR